MKVLKVNIDQLRKSNWTTEEMRNVELVTDFIQKLMNEHDFKYIEEKFGKNKYKQHNRSMPDGMGGILKTIKNLVKSAPAYTYDVKQISADGDLVHFHSHVTLKESHRGNPNKGLNIKDTWRIENGKIVEHWDAIQPINGFMRFFLWLSGGKVENDNTLF